VIGLCGVELSALRVYECGAVIGFCEFVYCMNVRINLWVQFARKLFAVIILLRCGVVLYI